MDNSKSNVLEELPLDVVELIEEVEEAAEAKKQQGELLLSSQITQNVLIQPKLEPPVPVEQPKAVVEQVEPPQPQQIQEAGVLAAMDCKIIISLLEGAAGACGACQVRGSPAGSAHGS